MITVIMIEGYQLDLASLAECKAQPYSDQLEEGRFVLEEIGTRGGKRMELAGEGSGQTCEGAREVNTSLYTRKMYVNQGGEWKDSG